jgi:adenylate kinase
MFQNIAFIGGIHGAGKSSICIPVAEKLNLSYLSASKILKWVEVSESPGNKKVADINFTQDRLILGLQQQVQRTEIYLLDGHFCLFNGQGDVKEVPLNTFERMRPAILFVVTDDPVKIAQRLGDRDGVVYDSTKLNEMQGNEVKYSQEVAKLLGIPHYIINQESISIFENLLSKFKETYENIA